MIECLHVLCNGQCNLIDVIMHIKGNSKQLRLAIETSGCSLNKMSHSVLDQG